MRETSISAGAIAGLYDAAGRLPMSVADARVGARLAARVPTAYPRRPRGTSATWPCQTSTSSTPWTWRKRRQVLLHVFASMKDSKPKHGRSRSRALGWRTSALVLPACPGSPRWVPTERTGNYSMARSPFRAVNSAVFAIRRHVSETLDRFGSSQVYKVSPATGSFGSSWHNCYFPPVRRFQT